MSGCMGRAARASPGVGSRCAGRCADSSESKVIVLVVGSFRVVAGRRVQRRSKTLLGARRGEGEESGEPGGPGRAALRALRLGARDVARRERVWMRGRVRSRPVAVVCKVRDVIVIAIVVVVAVVDGRGGEEQRAGARGRGGSGRGGRRGAGRAGGVGVRGRHGGAGRRAFGGARVVVLALALFQGTGRLPGAESVPFRGLVEGSREGSAHGRGRATGGGGRSNVDRPPGV